jgi:GT2 family glycosyltransferase
MKTESPSRIAIVIASTGRPSELGRWADHVRRQSLRPSILLCVIAKSTDLPWQEQVPEDVKVVIANLGSCHQRNAGLAAAVGCSDIIAFFDDDYVPSSYCVEGIDAFFRKHPDVVGANGVLLADGINSPGISYEDAKEGILRRDTLPRPEGRVLHDLEGLYGCNMVFRSAAIGSERFDEELPLYAWQEDIDFAVRVGKRGRIVKTDAFYGVHQGVKSGRSPGARLGYSQVVNPIYLARKGTLSVGDAAKLIVKNVLKNHVKSLWPEPWIDRVGRCKGNWLGIFDVLRRKDHPRNILSMPN